MEHGAWSMGHGYGGMGMGAWEHDEDQNLPSSAKDLKSSSSANTNECNGRPDESRPDEQHTAERFTIFSSTFVPILSDFHSHTFRRRAYFRFSSKFIIHCLSLRKFWQQA